MAHKSDNLIAADLSPFSLLWSCSLSSRWIPGWWSESRQPHRHRVRCPARVHRTLRAFSFRLCKCWIPHSVTSTIIPFCAESPLLPQPVVPSVELPSFPSEEHPSSSAWPQAGGSVSPRVPGQHRAEKNLPEGMGGGAWVLHPPLACPGVGGAQVESYIRERPNAGQQEAACDAPGWAGLQVLRGPDPRLRRDSGFSLVCGPRPRGRGPGSVAQPTRAGGGRWALFLEGSVDRTL